MRIHDILSPELAITAPAKITEIFDRGEPVSFEALHMRKDGSRFPVLVNIRETRWNGRRVLISASSDLSRQKKAETDLKDDEARLESLLRVSQYRASDATDLLDMALHEALALTGSTLGYIYNYFEDGKQFELNSWSKNVLKECTVIEKKTVYDLDKTGIWGEAVRQRRPVLINDFAEPNPKKRGFPEGHAPLQRFLTIPVFSGETIVAVVGVANKIEPYDNADVRQLTLLMDTVWKFVEHKRIEDRLRESELRFRSLFENSPAAIWEEDFSAVKKHFDELRSTGTKNIAEYLEKHPEEFERLADQIKIVNVNEASVRLLGASSHEELIRNLTSYFTTESFPVFRNEMISLFNGATEFSCNIPIVNASGNPMELKLQLNVVTGHENDLSRIIVSFIDLTELKNAERAMMRAEKLESLGILAAGIAHDFNNMLNGVFGYIDLARSTVTDEKTRINLEKAFSVFDRAKELAMQLLTYSKGGAPCLQTVDIALLLETAGGATLNGSPVKPCFNIAPDLAGCNADPVQISQVFINIIRNALDALPDGGECVISAVNIPAGSDLRAPSQNRPYIRIIISDKGNGIPAERIPHVFDPFYTTKPHANGLGLTTAYTIIKRHSGLVAIESQPGTGTSVFIYLPAVKSSFLKTV